MTTVYDLLGDEEDVESWRKTRNYLYQASRRIEGAHQIRQVILFLNETLQDTQLVKDVVQSTPKVLRHNVKTFLQPTTSFLYKLYGPDLFRLAIAKNPALLLTRGLGYDTDVLEAAEVYFREGIQLPKAAIRRLKRSHPSVFQLPLYKILTFETFFIDILVKAGKSSDESKKILAKMIASHPNLLQLSVDSNLRPRVCFLRQQCRLRDEDLAAFCTSTAAGVLGLSISDNLQPKVDLLSRLLTPDDLRKCVGTHPQILGLSLDNLHAKIGYFLSLEGLSIARNETKTVSLASKILSRSPAAYSLSLDGNILPKVEFLAHLWGFPDMDSHWEPLESVSNNRDSLASMLSEYTPILTLSLEGNIQPTVRFFNQTGYIALDDEYLPMSIDTTLLRARCMAASLYQRLLPRYTYGTLQTPPLGKIPLHLLCSASDTQFCKQMDLDADDFVRYKKQHAPSLKFNAQFDTCLATGRPMDGV